MKHFVAALLAVWSGSLLPAEEVVFRSDVSLVRVDAQVVDRSNRTVTNLAIEDFVLRENGQPREIRNFAREDMPVDVLILLDVSGSMRPHVERLASAAHQALEVLGGEDRVAMMVFDRATRLRLPFRRNHDDVEREFDALLQQERFDGGTDITRGLVDAVNYVTRNARREARRAIVIMTDDRTERDRSEAHVGRLLARGDIVLSALIAPDAMPGQSYPRGGGGRRGGWPGGPGIGFPGGNGPIILGRRGPYGGGPYPGGGGYPGGGRARTQSAGTAQIARDSGGDSLRVDDGQALETTLARIRQRYALHFLVPDGAKPGQERNIELELAANARHRHPDAEIRFRRTYVVPDGTSEATPVTVSQIPEGSVPPPPEAAPAPADAPAVVTTDAPRMRRRPAVSEPSGSRSAGSTGGWRRVSEPESTAPAPTPAPTAPAEPPATPAGGWRRVPPL